MACKSSFQGLNEHCRSILGVISFLMPDAIPSEVFDPDCSRGFPEHLRFCQERDRSACHTGHEALTDQLISSSFEDSIADLLTSALIKRNSETGVLSVHRTVQTQFRYFLSLEQRQKSFDNAVEMIYNILPLNEGETGQLYEVWDSCYRYTQHILHLCECYDEETKASRTFRATWKLCSLLSFAQRLVRVCFAPLFRAAPWPVPTACSRIMSNSRLIAA